MISSSFQNASGYAVMNGLTSISPSSAASNVLDCRGFSNVHLLTYLSGMLNDDTLVLYWTDDDTAAGFGAYSLAAGIADGSARLVKAADISVNTAWDGVSPDEGTLGAGGVTVAKTGNDGEVAFYDTTITAGTISLPIRAKYLILAWTTGQASSGAHAQWAMLTEKTEDWKPVSFGRTSQTLPDGFDPYQGRLWLAAP